MGKNHTSMKKPLPRLSTFDAACLSFTHFFVCQPAREVAGRKKTKPFRVDGQKPAEMVTSISTRNSNLLYCTLALEMVKRSFSAKANAKFHFVKLFQTTRCLLRVKHFYSTSDLSSSDWEDLPVYSITAPDGFSDHQKWHAYYRTNIITLAFLEFSLFI